MKNKQIIAITLTVGVVVAVSSVLAQQQTKNKAKTTEQKPSESSRTSELSPPLRSHSGSATQADPQAAAAYEAATRPITAMEEQARFLMSEGDLRGAEQLCLKAIAARERLGDMASVFDRNLLGEIYLKSGRYEKALATYLPNYQYTQDVRMNLNVALAYARLRNYQQAKRFYSDQALLRYSSIKKEDLPGTSNPQSLEASILLARGMEAFLTSRKQEALADFNAAGRLAPGNGLIPYYAGMSLVHLNRPAEAAAYFRRAAEHGRGKIAQDARSRAVGYK